LAEYATALADRGVKVVIAAAGLSAALPGAVAAHTQLPVIGIPVNAGTLGGLDALLSVSQMPPGVPVAAVTIGAPGAKNAALMAVRILAIADKTLTAKLTNFANLQRQAVLDKDQTHRIAAK
jgi:phosphoribosylaminoimidazole carboxylase PurE protein